MVKKEINEVNDGLATLKYKYRNEIKSLNKNEEYQERYK